MKKKEITIKDFDKLSKKIKNYHWYRPYFKLIIKQAKEARFRIEVNGLDYLVEGFRLPKGFIKVYSYWDRDIDVYWFILFVPFVRFWRLIIRLWWKPAKWFYKKGYLKHQEGEVEHWFRKIRLKKNIKNN